MLILLFYLPLVRLATNVQQLADVDRLIMPSDKEEPATWQMKIYKTFSF